MSDARGPESSPGMPEATRSGAGWRALIRERFALPPLFVIATAQATSAQYVVSARLDVTGLAIAVLGTTALMSLLRLMDELKDLDTDRLAHPNRPLARGALAPEEARRGLMWGTGALFAVALLIGVSRSPTAGTLYAVGIVCALLMYREFFVPDFLGERPLAYGVTHQIIVPPIYAFATACAFPAEALSAPVFWFVLTGIGASFAVEVSRKLDPVAHPALRTYLLAYGPRRTSLVIALSVALVVAAGYHLGVHVLLWPVAALMLATLPIVWVRPHRFRWVAGAAGLLAVVQILAPTIHHLWRAWP